MHSVQPFSLPLVVVIVGLVMMFDGKVVMDGVLAVYVVAMLVVIST